MTKSCPHMFKGQDFCISVLLFCRNFPEIQPHKFNGWISFALF